MVDRHRAVTRFIVGAKLAPASLDDDHTVALLSLFDPRYPVPTRQTFTNSLLPTAVREQRTALAADLKMAFAISLTIDMWTRHNQPFMVVTVHFVDGISQQLKATTLGLLHFEEKHTADNIVSLLEEELAAVDLKVEQIVALTTDMSRPQPCGQGRVQGVRLQH